jgi:hypothetical protein
MRRIRWFVESTEQASTLTQQDVQNSSETPTLAYNFSLVAAYLIQLWQAYIVPQDDSDELGDKLVAWDKKQRLPSTLCSNDQLGDSIIVEEE